MKARITSCILAINKLTRNIFNSIDEFQVIKILGNGSNGSVDLVKHKKTKQLFAIKKVVIDKQSLHTIQRQVRINIKLPNHPNINKCYDVFVNCNTVYFVLQYCPLNLTSFLNQTNKPISQTEVIAIFYQLASALAFLHSYQIIHRDIKYDNVLIDSNGCACLCDFGCAILLSEEKSSGIIHTTLVYSPPELKRNIYSKQGDIWAFGLVIFSILTKNQLFSSEKQWKQGVQKTIEIIRHIKVPQKWSLLMEYIFVNDHRKRIQIDEVMEYQFCENQEQQQILVTDRNLNTKIKDLLFKSIEFDDHAIIKREDFLQAIKLLTKIDQKNSIRWFSQLINEIVEQQGLNPDRHYYNKHIKSFIGINIKGIYA